MGLIFNPRKNKLKWAAVVMPSSNAGDLSTEALEAATDVYIQKHCKILYDSIEAVYASEDKKTLKERYLLMCKNYGALARVRKFTNKNQRYIVKQAIDEFVIVDDWYHHPPKLKSYKLKNKPRSDFWETYAEMKMIDIFLDDFK